MTAIHPEHAEPLERARSLTPEQLDALEAGFREQLRHFEEWVRPLLQPRVVGACGLGGWMLADAPGRAGRFELVHPGKRFKVIISGGAYSDGRRWIHLSFSHADRIPTWDELKAIKSRFLGDETLAVQVFPPKSQWVNVHPFCLHLWHSVDGDPLPDFRQIVGDIASI